MRFHPSPVSTTVKLSVLSIAALAGLFSWGLIGGEVYVSQAQAPPITPSGLHTQVSDLIAVGGQTQYDITGGTRPGGGTNLFHSFGDFSIPTNNIANFLNAGSIDLNGNLLDPNLPTSNILGRVTGGDPSAIFGMIQTNGPNGFGTANLFLINPAGFLFGLNATMNVGGMVAFTSADYLKLTDNARFNAIPNVAADALLTAFPIASFGFLGPNAASIAIQGGTLEVPDGKTLAFIGGPRTFTTDTGVTVPAGVTMTGGSLSAPNGLIYMATVTTPGEVPVPTLSGAPLGTLGPPSSDSTVIRIRSGEFVMDQATISADTVNADSPPVAIDINVTGNMSVTALDVPALTARTTGSGNAGKIRISSGTMDVTATTFDNFLFSVIDTHTSGPGNAGNVTIETTSGGLAITGDPFGLPLFIDSGTTGQGRGGDVRITATGQSVQMQDIYLSTGNFVANIFGEDATGAAGNVAISADSVHLTFSGIDTGSFSIINNTGRAGDISLTARDIQLENSLFQAQGFERGGAITVNADRVLLSDSRFETQTILNPGGGINILAKTVDLTQGSQLISVTGGDGDAGSITVSASEHIGILEGSRFVRPSGIFTQSFGTYGSRGNAGDVIITTPQLQMTAGGRINSVTKSSGHGGNITINATDSLFISGEFPDDISEPLFNLGPIHQSGIFASTIGGKCAGLCGDGGHISITTGSLILGNGAQIDSGTSSTGRGGDITIHTTNQTSMAGTLSDGSPVGVFSRTTGISPDSGAGGNIAITAGQSVMILDGASVSASSTRAGDAGNVTVQGLASPAQSVLIDGPGSGIFTTTEGTGTGGDILIETSQSTTLTNGAAISASSTGTMDDAGDAGKVTIHAGNTFFMQDSSVTTQAIKSGGGQIEINATNLFQLVHSTVSSSVLDGTGGGGDINIDPNLVVLQNNSQILAQAIQGAGGNITITTPLFLADSTSLVSASSQFGLNGTVTIQNPTSNLSGSVGTLPSDPSQAQSLLTQRCAALANGQASSFVVAGREQLPSDPGGWLTSPLYATG
ncbi:MAG: filamentous hemagglutinin N-terminal domain-containing protein, partial [Nitrospirota bacterium]